MDIVSKILNPALWPTRHDSANRSNLIKLILICIMVLTVFASDHEIEVNYDIGHYKLLQVNKTLELICKNLLNRDPPSWTYSSRLYRDPRMKLSQDVGESRLVISNAQAEDAGQYRCSIDHEYNGKTFHFNRTIEVIANEISDVKVEKEKDSIKLLCDVHAYPSATVTWKIDYDNKELNPQPEEPDLEEEYPLTPETKVVVDKSKGSWTLRPYKGVKNAELIIANVTENDNGHYSCVTRNLAGDQCKDCTVRVKRKATGTGKSSADRVDHNAVELKDEKNVKFLRENSVNLNAAKPKNENSRKGLGGAIILIILFSSFVVLGSVLGAVVVLWRMKPEPKKEQESQEGRSLPLINFNDALKV